MAILWQADNNGRAHDCQDERHAAHHAARQSRASSRTQQDAQQIAQQSVRTATARYTATAGVAAIAAAENGPYGDILRATEETVATDFGEDIAPEDKKALEDTLLAIAQKVDTQKAKDVAFQLASSGSEEKAAQLLPTIYANYYKNNSFSYAVAAVELGNCSGEKKAVIHFAEVLDKSIRWSIQNEIAEPLRSSKSKLSKCDSEGDWAILQSPTPVSSGKDIKSWTAEVQEQYASKGYKVKLQKEKKITLE